MTKGQDLRIATLNDARSRRSAEKRGAVEDAIMRLRDTRQAVTFVSVAREAKVSRQYLYNNFADEISEERVETRATPEEYRHIEAALRNKLERLEVALQEARAGKAKADRTAERERGKAEHWRQLYTAALALASPKSVAVDLPQFDD